MKQSDAEEGKQSASEALGRAVVRGQAHACVLAASLRSSLCASTLEASALGRNATARARSLCG
tara:strand:+ start:2456 stop:2644 length:189 start_codon:yes stop_codon:yes gene_type:complete